LVLLLWHSPPSCKGDLNLLWLSCLLGLLLGHAPASCKGDLLIQIWLYCTCMSLPSFTNRWPCRKGFYPQVTEVVILSRNFLGGNRIVVLNQFLYTHE
jgi:hypothetical protein